MAAHDNCATGKARAFAGSTSWYVVGTMASQNPALIDEPETMVARVVV
jgi:hypothetical protein